MKVGFFPMVADLLHCGHVIAIEEAKRNCDYLIVGLLCNPSLKGKRMPIQSTYERYMQLRSVKWVDEIVPYDAETSDIELVIKSLPFDIYFLGEDYFGKPFPCSEVLEEMHKEIFYIPRKHEVSSTAIIKRIKEEHE